MKLNWFSPLPPTPTEVAQYTARVLPVLATHAEITLWTCQAKWDRSLERYARVRSFGRKPFTWPEVHSGGLSIYNIGNNPELHGGIWEVSRQHPGVVILHDMSLQRLLSAVYREHHHDHAGYLALMGQAYGLEGEKAADDYARGLISTEYMDSAYPLVNPVLDNALGVVVHSRPAFEILRIENQQPLLYAPLPYAALQVRRPSTPPTSPYRLIVFAQPGQKHRLEQIFRALAEFPDRDAFHLDIFGQVGDTSTIRAWVQELRLERVVTLHGSVADMKLAAALDSAHLALNLCDQTVGAAASASQLRIWNHGLPSLVSRTGWYASLPEDAVAFVSPEQEAVGLQEHWRAFLADPGRFARMGARGRRLLEEEHAPEAYVQTLLDLIGSPEKLRLRASAHSLARRVGAEMSAWLNRDHTEDVYRSPAEQIRTLTL